MKTTLIISLIAVILASAVIVITYGNIFSNPHENPSPYPSYTTPAQPNPTIIPPIPSAIEITLSQYSANVTPGSKFSINATLTSLLDNETVTKTLAVQLLGYNNSTWSSGEPQRIFNASFSINPVALGPNESKSLTMMMNIAEDASFGRYVFEVYNVQFIVAVVPRVE